ncbi:MarR family transcriptional regulator [Modestobacter muralis]
MTIPRPSVVLDEQLCFSLYRTSRALTALYRPLLDQLGITYPQYLVLMALWEQDDQTVRELSDRVDLDAGTMSPMLKRMAALELVTRERSAADERQVRIRLTEAGYALKRSACGVSAALLEALAFDADRITELQQELDEVLQRVSSRIPRRAA